MDEEEDDATALILAVSSLRVRTSVPDVGTPSPRFIQHHAPVADAHASSGSEGLCSRTPSTVRERWLHELALATDGLDFSGAGFRPPSSSPEEVEELAALLDELMQHHDLQHRSRPAPSFIRKKSHSDRAMKGLAGTSGRGLKPSRAALRRTRSSAPRVVVRGRRLRDPAREGGREGGVSAGEEKGYLRLRSRSFGRPARWGARLWRRLAISWQAMARLTPSHAPHGAYGNASPCASPRALRQPEPKGTPRGWRIHPSPSPIPGAEGWEGGEGGKGGEGGEGRGRGGKSGGLVRNDACALDDWVNASLCHFGSPPKTESQPME